MIKSAEKTKDKKRTEGIEWKKKRRILQKEGVMPGKVRSYKY